MYTSLETALTTLPPNPVPGQADAVAQTAFRTQRTAQQAQLEAERAGLYYAHAVHPHPTRGPRAGCARGPQRPLPTVSGRERVNRNAALNAYQPPQVLL